MTNLEERLDKKSSAKSKAGIYLINALNPARLGRIPEMLNYMGTAKRYAKRAGLDIGSDVARLFYLCYSAIADHVAACDFQGFSREGKEELNKLAEREAAKAAKAYLAE